MSEEQLKPDCVIEGFTLVRDDQPDLNEATFAGATSASGVHRPSVRVRTWSALKIVRQTKVH